ncbi:hypothetical protein PG994_000675 [Apiospora phragmitis]|uniref:Ecp2 effector protein-like domain-containing protein n=1 Tax=Apiospora phragmitis TaxID=2905665 RepID=A0ABR1X6V2_9PEZI
MGPITLTRALLGAAAVVTAQPVVYGGIDGLLSRVLSMLYIPLNGTANHTMTTQPIAIEAKYFQIARYNSCFFYVKAEICDAQGSCSWEWPAQVGNGDVNFLLENAVKQIGNDEHIEAFGSMQCNTKMQKDGPKPLKMFWEIRNS